MLRLIPTGQCWCECGEQVELGSFFKRGHDRAAEKRIIMEEFGGSPGFIAAAGRGPFGVKRLLDLKQNTPVVIEYINANDRTGPYLRSERSIMFDHGDPNYRTAIFTVQTMTQFSVPLADVVEVYREGGFHIVRVHGTLTVSQAGQFDQVTFKPFAR